ncbi:MAG: hypothetical protein EWM50_06920, partial [Gottschalkiaceae bacterium]
SIKDVGNIFEEVKLFINLPEVATRTNFVDFLLNEKILVEEKIDLPKKKMTKYIFGNVSKYELAISINPESYLSHYTALFLHGLTDNVPKNIYTNMEQFKKTINQISTLEQLNIDRAFSRPMRKTNNIAKLKDFNVILLNGKNVSKLEVIDMEVEGKKLPITSIERTLIDIVTRPEYAGGVLEILNAYKEAKGRVSTGRLIATLNNFSYSYPYHQAIGFYLEKAGYEEKVLSRFDKLDKNYDFYLTYQMKDKSFSKRWRMYYPSYLD